MEWQPDSLLFVQGAPVSLKEAKDNRVADFATAVAAACWTGKSGLAV
jgi:hypothetical protein